MYTLINLVIFNFILYNAIGVRNETDCSESFYSRVGVFKSYNYPFNYTSNLSCYYKFSRPQGYSTAYICFRFHRFQLEESTGHCFFDHLLIGNTKYCHRGQYSHIFRTRFCLAMTQSIFTVTFKSDNKSEGRGFYAEYEMHTEKPTTPTTNNNNGCLKSQWRCFNRRCIAAHRLCDDVDDCGDNSDETFIHTDCQPQTESSCTFSKDLNNQDNGFCGYEGTGWNLTDLDQATGMKSTRGSYIFTMDNRSLPAMQISLSGRKPYCFRFAYSMTSAATTDLDPDDLRGRVTLSLYLQSSKKPVWSRDASYMPLVVPGGDPWYYGGVVLTSKRVHPRFEALISSSKVSSASTVSLDDISISPMAEHDLCTSNDISCNFESNLCSWKSSGWKRVKHKKGSASQLDAASSEQGWYAFVNHKANKTSTLSSAEITSINRAYCLMFSYYQNANNKRDAKLSIRIRRFSTLEGVTWMSSDVSSNDWIRQSVDISITSPLEIVFEATFGNSISEFALDDIVLYPAKCRDIAASACPKDMFTCSNGDCVTRCDSKKDCADGKDEADCPAKKQCGDKDAVICPNSNPPVCIIKEWMCDGFFDCDDGWDERCAGNKTICKENEEYACLDPPACLSKQDVCTCLDPKPTNCTTTKSPPVKQCELPLAMCHSTSLCVNQTSLCNKLSNCFQNKNDLYNACYVKNAKKSHKYSLIIIIVSCVCSVLLVTSCICVVWCYRNRQTRNKMKRRQVSHDVILTPTASVRRPPPAAAVVVNEQFLVDTMSTTSSATALHGQLSDRLDANRTPPSEDDSSHRSRRDRQTASLHQRSRSDPATRNSHRKLNQQQQLHQLPPTHNSSLTSTRPPSQRRIRLGTTALTNRFSTAYPTDTLASSGNLSDHTYESIPAYGYRRYSTAQANQINAPPPTLPRRPADQSLDSDHSRISAIARAYNSDIERSLLPTHV